MSLSNLLVPNNYNLFANSITTHVIPSESFSAKPSAASTAITVNAASPVAIPFNTLNVSSSNYNTSTYTYTIPKAGNYHFEIGAQVSAVSSGTDTMTVSLFAVKNGTVSPSLDLCTIVEPITSTSGGLPSWFVQPVLDIYTSFAAGDTLQIQISVASAGSNITSAAVLKQASYFIGYQS